MSLDSIRERIDLLSKVDCPTTIEHKRIERFNFLVRKLAILSKKRDGLTARQERWDKNQTRKMSPSARAKLSPVRPVATKEILDLEVECNDLMIELGEIPSEPFVPRARPVLSDIEFPPGPAPQFIYHTWLPLPPVPAGAPHRGKGPGENEINSLYNGVPPIGGRCDHAFPGGLTGETKGPDGLVFRGGASARKHINLLRRRVEAIIVQVRDLLRLYANQLASEDQLRLRYANHLLANVDESLLLGNMHDVDWQEFYTSLELLNQIQWNNVPVLYSEDPLIRDPQGVSLFCRYLDVTMLGEKCFFTDFAVRFRPIVNPTEHLLIPREDFNKTIRFLHLSKSDAYFKYFQPVTAVTPMKIGLVPGAYKPYHAGHDAVIRLAAEENDRVMVFVSLSDRDNVSGKVMQQVWLDQIQPSLPHNVQVFYGGSPVGEIYKLLGKANEENCGDIFSIYSDPTDAAQNYKTLDRYAGSLVANGQVKTRAIERTSTVDVSGTQMRQWLASGDKDQFIKNLPKSIDGEAVWSLLTQTRVSTCW